MNWMRGLFFAALTALAAVASAAPAQPTIKSDLIFPESTQAFFAITDTNELRTKWSATEMSRLLSDEAFNPFRDSIQSEIETTWTTRFGMTLDDVVSISSGEVAGGLIAFPGKKPGYALIVETVGKKDQVNSFLVKRIKQVTDLKSGKAETERLMIGNTPIDATVLTVPANETQPARTAWYIDLSSVLLITDDRFGAEQMLLQIAGQTQKSLAELDAYKAIMTRCLADLPAGSAAPQVRFFINPLEAGQAARALRNLSEKERSQASAYEILAKQGFNGIRGIGGILNLVQEDCESVLRVKAYIPDPPQLAFNMLSFKNDDTLAPPDWLGEDADHCTFMTLDPLNVFNNFGPLLDEFLETPGAWNDILVSLEKDENGPKVNLMTDLIAWLGNRLAAEVFYTLPLNEQSEKFVFALDIKPGAEQNVRDVLHRMFDTDPDFKKVEFDSDVIWQFVRSQKQTKDSGRRPSSRSRRGAPAQTAPAQDEELIAGGVFCVSSGYLFVSNDLDALRDLIGRVQEGKVAPVAQSQLYQKFMQRVQDHTRGQGRFIQGFNHSVNGHHLNYDLYRQGKLNAGNTAFSRIIRALSDSDAPRQPTRIVPSSLPDFDQFADRMGYGGFYGQVEKDGWFFTALRLKEDTAVPAPAAAGATTK